VLHWVAGIVHHDSGRISGSSLGHGLSGISRDASRYGSTNFVDWGKDTNHTDKDLPSCKDGCRGVVLGREHVVNG
jgi:hypothetical protein